MDFGWIVYMVKEGECIEAKRKWLPFCIWGLKLHFRERKFLIFKENLFEIWSWEYIWQQAIIGSDNGFVPNRSQILV